MFNNSSDSWLVTEKTLVPEMPNLLSCYRWYLRDKTVSNAQANEACSKHVDLVRLGTGTDIVFWLLGILIITANVVVLWGIIVTRKLSKTVSLLLANLATTDLFAGVVLLYRTVGHLLHSAMYKVILTFVDLTTLTQLLSASALSLLSVYSYVAIRHPIFFRIHAGSAERYVGIVLACTWVSFSLLTLSPNMGWNCIDMHILTTGTCIVYYPVAFVIICASMLLFLCGVMLFTNISTFIAIKGRRKKRFGKQVAPQVITVTAVNQHRINAQDEARRKFQRTLHRARTVMIHVVVAFVFWLLSSLFVAVCLVIPNMRLGAFACMCANSFINPIATLVRTPDLRQGIWQKLTRSHRIAASGFMRNRTIEDEVQSGPGNAPSSQDPTQKSLHAMKELPQTLKKCDWEIYDDDLETAGLEETSSKRQTETKLTKLKTENLEQGRNEQRQVAIVHI
ncbi:PREDICTED: sphingosine 1-phosphate receptor 1-like [Branchiostoma belcheri]|uniref:Sphingosine 1-phosphate receptor 1-like n=1 Tax=Branchiostoma belcheri TaxID=7741 RepID=A0A6P4YU57_BRABE|nr:PREDICTED: sphingosine 1-phosphate receptor 1-like [Branchiostoma belcheri]